MDNRYKRVAALRTAQQLLDYMKENEIRLPFDAEVQAAPQGSLAQALEIDGFKVGNRLAVLPMEGWDGTPDGRPSEQTYRRWQRFGLSGAKLIWGGEAAAVRHEGRANPNQLMINRDDSLGPGGFARRADPRARRNQQPDGRPVDRFAADPFRPVLPAK